eukprot:10471567-Alexandrium_andersonii.AAC.1
MPVAGNRRSGSTVRVPVRSAEFRRDTRRRRTEEPRRAGSQGPKCRRRPNGCTWAWRSTGAFG